jgi:cold shock CspA family protein
MRLFFAIICILSAFSSAFVPTSNFARTLIKTELSMKNAGTVKFFDSTKGFGFITPSGGGEDIFVHQQHITPKTSEYRSLQQGEYVSFQLGNPDTDSESAKHANQAINVTGVFGGSLMCDQITRRNGPHTPESSSSQEETRNGARFPRREVPSRDGPQFSRGGARGGRGGAGFSSSRPPRQNASS